MPWEVFFSWTVFVIVLLVFGLWVSLPYALRELRIDWLRLRGQFGLGFSLMCIGMTVRLSSDLIYEAKPPFFLMVTAKLILALGIAVAVRAMTFPKAGERTWITSVLTGAFIAVATFLLLDLI